MNKEKKLEVVFQNKNYKVRINRELCMYEIYNEMTEMTETLSETLPEAVNLRKRR